MLKLSTGDKAVLWALDGFSAATHKTTARGHNDLAFDSMRFKRGKIVQRLDRPSKFTQTGVQVEKATQQQSTAQASVLIEDKRAKYLALQEEGGELNKANAGATRGSGSNALVIPVSRRMQNVYGSAGRNAVKRALRRPGAFLSKIGVRQRQ